MTTTGQAFSEWAWIVSAAAVNGAAFFTFFRTFGFRKSDGVSLASMLSEKDSTASTDGGSRSTSSARVISFLGGMLMVCLVWGVANVILFNGLGGATAEQMNAFLTPVSGFLLSGMTFFAPYLINQGAGAIKAGQAAQADADVKKAQIAKDSPKPEPNPIPQGD